MMRLIIVLALYISLAVAQTADSCSYKCNARKREILEYSMCRDAKKVLPRPKVGDFCTMAMEQGFSDACMDLCAGKIPVSRLAQTCRAASMEMPRPTVRRWCEHGYQVAFTKTKKVMATEFVDKFPKAASDSEPAGMNEGDASPEEDKMAAAEKEEEQVETRKLTATLPITLDDKVVDLHIFDGDSAEDAVVVFCREHLSDDIASCIRELLPTVIDRLQEGKKPAEAEPAAATTED